MKDADMVEKILLARTKYRGFVDLGVEIGKLYTDYGLPIDIALSELKKRKKIKQGEMLAVIAGACDWLIEHRRASGAPEKAIERQRKLNRQMVERFLKIGEVGVY